MYGRCTSLNLRIVVALALAVTCSAVTSSSGAGSDETRVEAFDHRAWDRLLGTYVDDAGRVAYRRLQVEDSGALYAYLDALASASPDDWSAPHQLAFWINAYNAGIVSAVLQGQSAEGLFGRGKIFKLWKFEVAGKKRTLDEVEHSILRKRFDEPRIHFALVCASTSCPALRNEAFDAVRLDAQLDDQARAFIRDPRRNRFDRAANEIRLSQIFDWFAGDFESHGGVLAFVARYVEDDAVRDWLAQGAEDADIDHLDYDWTLNVQPDQRPEKESRRDALARVQR